MEKKNKTQMLLTTSMTAHFVAHNYDFDITLEENQKDAF